MKANAFITIKYNKYHRIDLLCSIVKIYLYIFTLVRYSIQISLFTRI